MKIPKRGQATESSMASNIIDQLALLRFGALSADSKTRLKRDLKRYRASSAARISGPAIDNWFNTEATPNRAASYEFLHSYLTNNVVPTPENQKLYASLESFLRPLEVRPHSNRSARPSSQGNLYVIGMIDTIVDRGRRSDRSEIDDFFYCSPGSTELSDNDHSFYVIYHYSTKGRIVKEFLICKRPQHDLVTSFSFLRFMRGDKRVFPELIRESEGIILKWETSYNFLGFNYRMPEEEPDRPIEYAARRMAAKARPRGIELMAFEYVEIDVEHGLFSGLAMTVGAVDQPIATRVAVLHLGTVAVLGRNISHHDVQPNVFNAAELVDDLRSTVSRMQELGCKRFAPKLNSAVTKSDWRDQGSAKLADEIIGMLDNIPGWEMDNPNRPKERHGRGAIETFSRTGNRPRT